MLKNVLFITSVSVIAVIVIITIDTDTDTATFLIILIECNFHEYKIHFHSSDLILSNFILLLDFILTSY